MGMFNTAVQSALLSMISNVLAQTITCWKTGTSLNIDLVRLFQFVSFSILACPPNYLWQRFLEAQFPAYTAGAPSTEQKVVDGDSVSGKSTSLDDTAHRRGQSKVMKENSIDRGAQKPAKQLSIRNTVAKFTLDQTIGAAVNTVLFIAGIALLRGQTWSSTIYNVQEQFWPMIFAGQKLWPAVSILSFTVVPLEHRMLFGSVAGLFWGVYLSLVAGG